MRQFPILNYQDWLTESNRLILEQTTTSSVQDLYTKQDLNGLVKLAMSTDVEAVKSHEAYAAVMDWWSRGKGKEGPLFKKGSEKKKDIKNTLNSLFYWNGGTANKMNNFFKVADAILANANLSTPEKMQDFKSGIDVLKNEKANGFSVSSGVELSNLLTSTLLNSADEVARKIPGLTAASKDQVMPIIANKVLTGTFLTKVNALVAKKNDKNIWTASVKLDEATKVKLLDAIKAKADEYASKKQDKSAIELIETASDLYVMPSSSRIEEVPPTIAVGPPKTGSYPADANGDAESEAFKLGKAFFPDDGVTLTQTAIDGIRAAVNASVSAIRSTPDAKINKVTVWGYSSTSKVPTSYKSGSTERSQDNNQALAEDRLKAINAALVEAFKNAGVDVEPTVDETKNKADANRGPEWGDAQRANKEKYGEPGKRTDTYEKEYGDYRYARAFYNIEYETSEKPVSSYVPVGEWKAVVSWDSESIGLPKIGGGNISSGTGSVVNYSGSCPVFGN